MCQTIIKIVKKTKILTKLKTVFNFKFNEAWTNQSISVKCYEKKKYENLI